MCLGVGGLSEGGSEGQDGGAEGSLGMGCGVKGQATPWRGCPTPQHPTRHPRPVAHSLHQLRSQALRGALSWERL